MGLFLALLVGSLAGILSGFFGIGGGVVVVPALMLLLGLTQLQATATSLAALLLPVGILGVLNYYRVGAVNLPVAALLALGLLVGTYFGSRIALTLPEPVLRRGFAALLILVALQLLLKR
ncbi:MAG: TSUP family transporter [Thermaceae bacterium]|nr:TSUP family transporter [Thermaceae bacterium]